MTTQNDNSQAVALSAEQEREAFEKVYRHLDLSQKLNVWNVSVYAQTHVQALWQGWIDRAALSAHANKEPKND